MPWGRNLINYTPTDNQYVKLHATIGALIVIHRVTVGGTWIRLVGARGGTTWFRVLPESRFHMLSGTFRVPCAINADLPSYDTPTAHISS